MKNLKTGFVALSLITALCCVQNALAMHQINEEMSEQEQLNFLGSLERMTFLRIVQFGNLKQARYLISTVPELRKAIRVPKLSLLAEVMDEEQYAIAHMLIKDYGADITALSQAYQEAYQAYLFALANAEYVAHIAPHPVAAPAAQEEEKKENAAPAQKNKKGSTVCAIS